MINKIFPCISHETNKDSLKKYFYFVYFRDPAQFWDSLSVINTDMLLPSTGDRPGVPNVVISFTDGSSNLFSRRVTQKAEDVGANTVQTFNSCMSRPEVHQ